MKKDLKKLISLFLLVSVLSSLVVLPVRAASDNFYDYLIEWAQHAAKVPASLASDIVNSLFNNEPFGMRHYLAGSIKEVTPSELVDAMEYYNTNWRNAWKQYLQYGILADYFGAPVYAVIRPEENTNRMRLLDSTVGAYVTDKKGGYIWCSVDDWNSYWGISNPSEDIVIDLPSTGGNQWLEYYTQSSRKITFDFSKAHLVSQADLSATITNLINAGVGAMRSTYTYKKSSSSVDFYIIIHTVGEVTYILCDRNGNPYVAAVTPEKSMSDTSLDYISNTVTQILNNQESQKEEEIPEEDGEDAKVLDIENKVLTIFQDFSTTNNLNISDVSIDLSTNTYTVNAYDIKNTYDITNNYYYYEYNYYTYNIQYTYNNTYVTYIGSSAEFVPTVYEYYYQLPDGRSSADLTEEDIAGLSFQFSDVLNYKKSATDTSLRALYHFDGNTNDSSFWSGQGDFTWNTGASITYMESNAFNGALYLDEKAHQFTITLPSGIGSGDFSMQWRYYQNSATTTNNNENYVMFGSTKLLGWSEQTLYNGSGTKVGDLSVGTWQELALVRNSGTLYMYHNGVKLASISQTTVFNNTIVFYLGPGSRAYSMIDELRFVNFAIAKAGAAYTPTAVPFDTNSILVLPDGATPVAEEHWEFDKTIKPYLAWDFTDSSSFKIVESGNNTDTQGSTNMPAKTWPFWIEPLSSLESSVGSFVRAGGTSSLGFYDGFAHIGAATNDLYGGPSYISYTHYLKAGLFYVLSYGTRTSTNYFSLTGNYTLTAVFKDGSMGSITFTDPFPSYTDNIAGPFTVKSGSQSLTVRFQIVSTGDRSNSRKHYCLDFIHLSGNADIVYLEIVKGSKGNTGHKFVSSVYSSDEIQPNTAAIQSDIPVNGYTVGGVRPTFPSRGDVWFPVEGNRISGVYIYNGQAWEETNARWWTGKRWIPIYAFDIVTLADLWDVTDASGETVTPAITSDYSFWNWWKNAWNSFTDKLFGVLGGSGSGGGGSGGDSSSSSSGSGSSFFGKIKDALANGISTLIEGLFDVITQVLQKIISAVTDLLTSLFSFVTDTVLGGIKSFFSSFTDGSLFEFFQTTEVNEEGEEVTTAALPEGIAAVFALFSGIIMLLPWEIRAPLFFLIGALALISVFKFVLS